MKNYKSNILLMFFALSALLLIGCAKSDQTTNRDATAPSTAPAASPAATTTTASTGADIGVPECDAYLKAYEACIHDKIPAAQRATFETAMANSRKAWQAAAASPQGKATLAAACKTAHEQAKASVKIYGCTL